MGMYSFHVKDPSNFWNNLKKSYFMEKKSNLGHRYKMGVSELKEYETVFIK